ncbi:MAG: hypothetical protein Q8M03_09270, partial [Legionella sp.]|nr:hypothetical protein [Legionella sp.]
MIAPPKLNDILAHTLDAAAKNNIGQQLPAHVKPVARIDPVRLFTLSSIGDDLSIARTAWDDYILRPNLYEQALPQGILSARDVPVASIAPAHSETLLSAGVFEPIPHSEVRGYVMTFFVLETLKNRVRIIQHTKSINELMEDACDVSFTSLSDRRLLVWYSDYAATLDFASYYHQFELDPSVRPFFCARLPMPDGTHRLCRLRVGATGQKHMVHTAVATTNLLLSFPKLSAVSDTQIDNIYFGGTREALLSDLTNFVLKRCHHSGVTINDLPADLSTISPEILAALITQKIDWVGLSLDLAAKTVCCTKKFTDKLKLSWYYRSEWSWQGFACHIGLL